MGIIIDCGEMMGIISAYLVSGCLSYLSCLFALCAATDVTPLLHLNVVRHVWAAARAHPRALCCTAHVPPSTHTGRACAKP